jgi:ribosomal protein S18 acetylase RimI-like enzyme
LPHDRPFLLEMLYEAAYWRTDRERPKLAEGLARPDLVLLMAEWGRPGDVALIAADGHGTRLGAAWFRLWTVESHGYGFVDEATPEIGLAVKPEFRHQGVGTSLFMNLMARAQKEGFSRISLSVESANPARRLYARFGFKPVREDENALTLLRELGPELDGD